MGNRKLAVEMDKRLTIYEMTEKLSKVINALCERNGYTFSYHNVNADADTLGLLKNIPILPVTIF